MNKDNSLKIAGIVAGTLILLALISLYFFQGFMPDKRNTISARGYSSLTVTADRVTVNFNIETNASTAKEAKDLNNEILEKLNLALISIGIEKSQIQTSGFSIHKNQFWERDRMVTKGYKASHQIKIELDTNESILIANVIDVGINSGALLNHVNFELSMAKQRKYKAQALRLAGEDAKLQARAMAEGVGKDLGKLISVSSSDFNYRPWNIYSAIDGVRTTEENIAGVKLTVTNIVPGSQELTAGITVIYQIK